MSDEKLVVSKETFMTLDAKSQNGVLYDFITDIHSRVCEVENCIESSKIRSGLIAALTGLIAGSGGTLAVGKILISIGFK